MPPEALRVLRDLLFILLLASVPAARADEVEIRDSTGTVLRLIGPSRFERGSRDLSPGFHKDHTQFEIDSERPVHPVVLTRPYYIAATEVTVAQFDQFVRETGYVTTAERSRAGIVGWDPTPPADNPRFVATFRQKPEFTWRKPGFEQGPSHPVVGVSFEDAEAFCAWLSKKEKATYRLPTEAEWENAARAGTATWFSFGDAYRGTIHQHANIGNVELERAFPDRVRRQWLVDAERDPPDQHVFTAPVGSYAANPWKLHDFSGNVWEWCADRFLDTSYKQFDRPGYQQARKRAIDPRNDTSWNKHGDWRVIRGGSWFNAPVQCRTGHRGFFEAGDAASHLGFRVVREASPTAVAAARERFERSEAARTALDQLSRLREERDGRVSLRLQRNQITDDLAKHLQDLDEPIDLHINGDARLTGAEVAILAKASQLRGLQLGNCGQTLTDADFAVLAAHPDLELLQITEVSGLTDALFVHLAELRNLELLHLHGDGITDAGLNRLPDLPRMKTLYLAGTQASGAVLEKLRGAPLENVSFSNFHDEHASRLSACSRLRHLRLGGSPITGRTLAELGSLSRLDSLELDRCAALTDDDFRHLSLCMHLQRLQLDGCAAGDTAAAALAELNKLTDLRIGSPRLSDAGARTLCGIVSLRNLSLLAEATAVTDGGLRDIWRLRNLQSLEINAPQITGRGLSALHELAELRNLYVSSPAFTDAGLREIARNPRLEQLSLGGWQTGAPAGVTDAALEHLAQARSLRQVNLFRKNGQVTDAGVEALKKRKPDLTVNLR